MDTPIFDRLCDETWQPQVLRVVDVGAYERNRHREELLAQLEAHGLTFAQLTPRPATVFDLHVIA